MTHPPWSNEFCTLVIHPNEPALNILLWMSTAVVIAFPSFHPACHDVSNEYNMNGKAIIWSRMQIGPLADPGLRSGWPLGRDLKALFARMECLCKPQCNIWLWLLRRLLNLLSPGPCITNVIATCRKNFSQWESSFLWKLRCHWLKFLRRVAKTLVIQGPGPGALKSN